MEIEFCKDRVKGNGDANKFYTKICTQFTIFNAIPFENIVKVTVGLSRIERISEGQVSKFVSYVKLI
jgi:hypothetical protein